MPSLCPGNGLSPTDGRSEGPAPATASVNSGNHRKPRIVWLHLREVSRRGKPIKKEIHGRLWLGAGEWGWAAEKALMGPRGLLGDDKIF